MTHTLKGRAIHGAPAPGDDNPAAPCIFCNKLVKHINDGGTAWMVGGRVRGKTNFYFYCGSPPCKEAEANGKDVWRCGCESDYLENIGDRCYGCGVDREHAVPYGDEAMASDETPPPKLTGRYCVLVVNEEGIFDAVIPVPDKDTGYRVAAQRIFEIWPGVGGGWKDFSHDALSAMRAFIGQKDWRGFCACFSEHVNLNTLDVRVMPLERVDLAVKPESTLPPPRLRVSDRNLVRRALWALRREVGARLSAGTRERLSLQISELKVTRWLDLDVEHAHRTISAVFSESQAERPDLWEHSAEPRRAMRFLRHHLNERKGSA